MDRDEYPLPVDTWSVTEHKINHKAELQEKLNWNYIATDTKFKRNGK